MSATAYPVKVDASLDTQLSRWKWALKWLMAIPHYLVLSFLWIAFVVLSVVAFFAILFTGRYPRSIFDFNVGVLRWTWRVQYYAYGALGTDRYPPFSLDDDPDYPAHLSVEYPERLSRGLVLVKWWLLAIPQYLIVGLFAGGGSFAVASVRDHNISWPAGGLIGLLVFAAAIILAITGRYPDSIFGFVLGMNRWVLRVAAYASLMTDKYPPFRFDGGGSDPGSDPGGLALTTPALSEPVLAEPVLTKPVLTKPVVAKPAPAGQEPQPAGQPGQPPARAAGGGWGAGRVICMIIGSLLLLTASGLLAGSAGGFWANQAARQGGYVTSSSTTYTTAGRALVSATVRIPATGLNQLGRELIGKVRIRATASDPARPVFLGIAPAQAVTGYLTGVRYTTVQGAGSAGAGITTPGAMVPGAPGTQEFWIASSAGPGTRSVSWPVSAGNWDVVVMNADASAGLTVTADAGATAPVLPWIAGGLLAAGALALIGGVLLILIPVRRASASRKLEATRRPGPADLTAGR
jgi:Domain of unknown function (DUF4389)